MGVTKGKTRIERNVLSALLLIVVFYLFGRKLRSWICGNRRFYYAGKAGETGAVKEAVK